MRDDQRKRLEEMQETVLDQFLDQQPIEQWAGWENGDTRSDRYWTIKIKAAELALYEKMENVLARRGSTSVTTGEDKSIEKTIKKYEKKVADALSGGLAEKYRKPTQPYRPKDNTH
ncbi:MAG: hypothetical protein E6Q97_22520 [Desulfurellales bacterium]|jgi:predicted RNA-binding Zn ribbon-like protein|nr:MAG: hypothetical protein E6Q97_22520 [Desulfurellales bacterium]